MRGQPYGGLRSFNALCNEIRVDGLVMISARTIHREDRNRAMKPHSQCTDYRNSCRPSPIRTALPLTLELT